MRNSSAIIPAETIGRFIKFDGSGHLRIERGYVRPEDEILVELESEVETQHEQRQAIAARVESGGETMQAEPLNPQEPEDDEGLKPIPDRLMTELTARRTLALRHALGEQPDLAFLAALHALCIKVFYLYAVDTCLELDLKSVGFGAQAPGLNDTARCEY
jgi:ParB family chromosome partitioning protein